MFAILAVAIDTLHALAMVLWVAGLPALFWHRWPRLTRAYGWYSVAFVALNVGSQWLLGECFLTTIARACWSRAGSDAPEHVDDWFTVRFAEQVFQMTPSHFAVKRLTEGLILLSAIGTLYWMHRLRRKASAPRAQ